MEERVDEVPSRAQAPPATERLEVERHHPRSGVLLLQVRGELVARTAAVLERHLADVPALIDRGRRVLLDLAGITSITAAGLDALLRLQDAVTAAGGSVELLAAPPAVVLMLHEAAGR
jgi:anti-anti-sigma factor